MLKFTLLTALYLCFGTLHAQQPASFTLTVTNEKAAPLTEATVELLSNNKLVKAAITDAKGNAVFENIATGSYSFSITLVGYKKQTTALYNFSETNKAMISLQATDKTLEAVTVSSKKPLIQHKEGKTIINVEAAVTNTGTTVLEVLEKSPGVMVDKNGGLSLQGKAGVLVMIDDKPTYLNGADLNNLLSSMSSSQVDEIELMPNPPAKYDASGNAGIINIKTKKNKVKGFNGSVTVAGTQGVYPKNNNSLIINYRSGKFNMFFNYSLNNTKYFTSIYALRKYYNDNNDIIAILDQPTYFTGRVTNHTIKAGIDYNMSPKTTIGIVLGGTRVNRKGKGDATATWLSAAGATDSSIITNSTSGNRYKSETLNGNLRHSINKQQDLALDIDWLNYNIRSEQLFNNRLQANGGYTEAARGNIPTGITILSAKADHALRFGKNSTLQSGFKSSHISTNNIASYQNFDGINWQEDYGRSNHFLYKENINALYSSLQTKYKRISMQAGLRYEATSYQAHQLGNVQQKDSAFSRKYSGLFPSGYITYQVDSSNVLTFTGGRRIDRPPFQTLNPFTSIINKYTYQSGNPFIVPQYSTNMEISHQYKEWLTTTISYSIVKNYFSQIFLNDTIAGLLYYSQGNVGRTHNLGLSSIVMLSPTKWWSFTFQATYNHKELKGFNGDANFKSNINQLNINMSNQFTFAKIYSGELSGFFTSRARNDLQEVLYPTGQLSMGISRPVLKKKGTLKLSFRDVFFTNAMEGFTNFTKATEYFILRRDSRVINIAFTYRFGKAYKTAKRSSGSAGDEMERVGNG
ncbi:MAG: outer membrane beta-barrel family protein [Ferruginibacter sp.]|nr:TonB-dependent receptor [Chitinophagaceae bacterium]